MAVSRWTLKAELGWVQSTDNDPFADSKQGPDKIDFSPTIVAATFSEVFAKRYVIAASGNQTIDLFAAFTNLLGASVSPTKVCGLIMKASGTGAIAVLEPGGSNPLPWPLQGTAPELTIPAGGVFLFYQPWTQVIDATNRNLLITETGAAELTLDVGFIVGP